MKTAELTGRALQHAVMLAEGWVYFMPTPGQCAMYGRTDGPRPLWTVHGKNYLTGSAGDDIIDREKIGTEPCCPNRWRARAPRIAVVDGTEYSDPVRADGATRREAAMRAYAAAKLGDDVDIPEELQ